MDANYQMVLIVRSEHSFPSHLWIPQDEESSLLNVLVTVDSLNQALCTSLKENLASGTVRQLGKMMANREHFLKKEHLIVNEETTYKHTQKSRLSDSRDQDLLPD